MSGTGTVRMLLMATMMMAISSTAIGAATGFGPGYCWNPGVTTPGPWGNGKMGPGPGGNASGVLPTEPAISFAPGWNLVGNGVNMPIDVVAAYNDTTKFATVWKWVASGSSEGVTYPTWAFYAPGESDGGQAFAASKGYEHLTTITPGEGFWVNALLACSVPLPAGEPVQSNSFGVSGSHPLPSGWCLIATGDFTTPAGFNSQLAEGVDTPPTVGETQPTNVLSMWAWDPALQQWYFWSPGMANDGTLNEYIASKNCLGFNAMQTSSGVGVITPSMGFWVDMP